MFQPSVTRGSFRQYDRDHGQAGMYCLSMVGASLTTLSLTVNRAYFTRFVPSRNILVVSIGFEVTTAASLDDACDVGIYNSALERLGSAGATTGKLNATGNKSAALTVATQLVAGGVYYAAFSSPVPGGTAASVRAYNFVAAGAVEAFGAAAPQVEAAYLNSGHVLPSTATFTATTSSSSRLWVKES